MERERFGTPFRNPIVSNEFTQEHERMQEIKGTSKLVRRYHLDPNEPQVLGDYVRDLKHGVFLLKRFGSYDGINLPEFSPVLGMDEENNPAFFLVTERIDGENLSDTKIFPSEVPDLKRNFNSLMIGITNYTRKVYEARGEYLFDQNLSQYVYGKGRDGDKKIYFVDLGMESSNNLSSTTQDDYSISYNFGHYLMRLSIMTLEFEEKIGGRLDESREALEDFIRSIPNNANEHAHSLMSIDLLKNYNAVQN